MLLLTFYDPEKFDVVDKKAIEEKFVK